MIEEKIEGRKWGETREKRGESEVSGEEKLVGEMGRKERKWCERGEKRERKLIGENVKRMTPSLCL